MDKTANIYKKNANDITIDFTSTLTALLDIFISLFLVRRQACCESTKNTNERYSDEQSTFSAHLGYFALL